MNEQCSPERLGPSYEYEIWCGGRMIYGLDCWSWSHAKEEAAAMVADEDEGPDPIEVRFYEKFRISAHEDEFCTLREKYAVDTNKALIVALLRRASEMDSLLRRLESLAVDWEVTGRDPRLQAMGYERGQKDVFRAPARELRAAFAPRNIAGEPQVSAAAMLADGKKEVFQGLNLPADAVKALEDFKWPE